MPAHWSPRSPAERVLMALKMHGALTAAQIGRQLGTTGEAARQQLTRLSQEGLVREEARAAGRGRPAIHWHLTDQGQTRFPDTHAALTVDLLRSVRDVLGEAALDSLIAAREAGTQARYQQALARCDSLKDRVTLLAEMRSTEGYMASAEETPQGMLLIENHCPICAAASFCQGFCRAEKAIFQHVLGEDTVVERHEHIVDGGRRCTYLIRETR